MFDRVGRGVVVDEFVAGAAEDGLAISCFWEKALFGSVFMSFFVSSCDGYVHFVVVPLVI